MADTATAPLRVPAPKLETFTAKAFEAVGISAAEAKSIAELMVREGGVAPARLAAHWLGADEELRAAPHLAALCARHPAAFRPAPGA